MSRNQKPTPQGNRFVDVAPQIERFVEAAREVGADENAASFDKVLKRVASAPPPKTVQRRKKETDRSK